MNVGDFVTWKSQAGGFVKTKTGVIVAVVPAGVDPERVVRFPMRLGNYGMYRDHESYLIKVQGCGSLAYWPRVKHLELAKGE